jgi:hypothetical protein
VMVRTGAGGGGDGAALLGPRSAIAPQLPADGAALAPELPRDGRRRGALAPERRDPIIVERG